MKKSLNILLYLSSFSLLFVACSHSHDDLSHNHDDHNSYITINSILERT